MSFLMLVNNIGEDLSYKKYCNARFDFCVEYPASFVNLPPPENNDGLTFLSTDKKTKILAFGSLASEDFDRIDGIHRIGPAARGCEACKANEVDRIYRT